MKSTVDSFFALKSMNCNCSDIYCASKIPKGAIVDCSEYNMIIRVRNVITHEIKLITHEMWSRWCDNLHCNPLDGYRYELYVQTK